MAVQVSVAQIQISARLQGPSQDSNSDQAVEDFNNK